MLPRSDRPFGAEQARNWLYRVLGDAQACCTELASILNDVFPRASSGSLKHVFEIGVHRAALEDGRCRVQRDDVFVLLAMFEGTFDQRTQLSLRNEIRAIVASERDHDLICDLGADTLVLAACSGYPERLCRLSESIYGAYQRVIGGTDRANATVMQAITFGSLTVEYSREGQVSLKEKLGSSCISVAGTIWPKLAQQPAFGFQVAMSDRAWQRLASIGNSTVAETGKMQVEFRGVQDHFHLIATNPIGTPSVLSCANQAGRSDGSIGHSGNNSLVNQVAGDNVIVANQVTIGTLNIAEAQQQSGAGQPETAAAIQHVEMQQGVLQVQADA